MSDQPEKTLWRISNHLSLAGKGGERASGRWHTIGHPIVYMASSAAGALIEHLVHLDIEETDLPSSYTLLKVENSSTLEVESLDCTSIAGWGDELELTRKMGDEWLRSERSPIARVPSIIIPETWNYLLNPLHVQSQLIRIAFTQQVNFDPRLLRKVRL